MGQSESVQGEESNTFIPSTCLSFNVRGPWGHFRRIEGNIVKQTYLIMPRTTVTGLIAAILGLDRDSYYDIFQVENSAIAIQPMNELRTINMPMNTLSTSDSDLTSVNSRGKISMKLPDPSKPRQQHNYEVLVEPAYRIDIGLRDTETYQQLKDMLVEGKSYYSPSLGLSEYLAEVNYLGEFSVAACSDSEVLEFNSAVPAPIESVLIDEASPCRVEQSPGFMELSDGGRITTEFTTYSFNPLGQTLEVKGEPAWTVDDRVVSFV